MNKHTGPITLKLFASLWLLTCLPNLCLAANARSVSPEAKANFEWFNGLGFPDVKNRQFIRIATGWWRQVGQEPPQNYYKNGFLLTSDANSFTPLDLELFNRTYKTTEPGTQEGKRTGFDAIDLKSEANAFLKRIAELRYGDDLFDRLDERVSKRVYTFVFAWGCWRNGLDDEAERLYETSKTMRYGSEEIDETNYRLTLEQEIAHAMMWRAITDFADTTISRQSLLERFQNIVTNYPHSSHQPRAKQTVEILTRMIAEDEIHAETAPTNLAQLTVDEIIRELIFRLRDQHGEQAGQPGWCDIFADWHGQTNSAAHQLVKIGYPAVPQLIATLEDPTFTRSVGYWRDFCFSHTVLTVGDCSQAILERIAGKSFYRPSTTSSYMSLEHKNAEVKKLVEDWWREFQQHGELATLVSGTERGDDSSPQQAALLLERFPQTAIPALAKGLQAATNKWARTRLVSVMEKDNSPATFELLTHEACDGIDASRATAADILFRKGNTNIVETMIMVWATNTDYLPENYDGLPEVARFLAGTDSPRAIAALAKNIQARPLKTRMAILTTVGEGGTKYGEIRPADKRPPIACKAVEDFLMAALTDDGQRFHASGTRNGKNYNDPRVSDMAGFFLNQLWPQRYDFDISAPVLERDQQRTVCQNFWKLSHK